MVYPLKEHAVIIDIKIVKEQYLYCKHCHNSPKVHDSIQTSSHFVDCISGGVLFRDTELSNVVQSFVVAVVVGVLFGGTRLTNVFTGSVLVAVLLNDPCVVRGFMDVGTRVLLGKMEPLCDSVTVGVRKVSIEVLVKPMLIQKAGDGLAKL